METNVNSQGTAAGEPEGAAAGSGMSDEELLRSLDLEQSQETTSTEEENEHIKWLREKGLKALPQDVKDELEKPFLQHHTKRNQEIAEEQRRFQQTQAEFFQKMTEKLAASGIAPTTDEQAEIRERVRAGDPDALDAYVQSLVDKRVGPIQTQQAVANAIAEANKLHPRVGEMQEQIVGYLREDPTLLQIAAMGNFAVAPRVLASIAEHFENVELKKKMENFEAEKKAYAREAIAAHQRRLQGLPPKTSLAGPQTGTRSSGPDPQSFQEAAAKTLRDLGIPTPEEWR